VLVLVATGGLVFGLHRSSSRPTINQEVLQIAGEVRCPVCNGETAAQSQAAASVQIRNQILHELQAGESKDQILAGLVQAYGTGILEKPQPSGVGLVVWVVPVVAVLVAAGVLGLAFVRWRNKAAGEAALSDAAHPAGGSPAAQQMSRAPVAVAAPALAPAVSALHEPRAGAGVGAGAGPVAGPVAVGEEPPAAATPEAGPPASDPEEAAAPDISPGLSGPRKRPARPPIKPWKKWAVAGAGLALIAGGASWALVKSTTTRLAGESITGQALGPEAIEQDLNTAANDLAKGDAVAAIKEYQKILDSDPAQPDALTGEGWTLAESGQPSLLQQGLKLLASAEQSDPTYAPAHVYRGLALLSEDDYTDSVPELQWYLAHNPDPQVAPEVRTELKTAEAGAAAEAKATAGSTVPAAKG
jgi:cytochrome c-type biogenesis protein CcmH